MKSNPPLPNHYLFTPVVIKPTVTFIIDFLNITGGPAFRKRSNQFQKGKTCLFNHNTYICKNSQNSKVLNLF